MGKGVWRLQIVLAVVLACVLTIGTLSGCSVFQQEANSSQTNASEPEDPEATANGDSQILPETDQIPPGREIREGNEGPVQYTFREEWRRGLAEAQKWNVEAYLISATGQYVNDEGVPSEWRFCFIGEENPTALLLIDIDPWGDIIKTQEIIGDDINSFVNEYDRPISYDVIDSDEAVEIGKKAIGSKYNLDKTKDPSISLGYSIFDGSGPNWQYMVFYVSTAEYVSAQIDALTGEVILIK
jgi:hypothetical protein